MQIIDILLVEDDPDDLSVIIATLAESVAGTMHRVHVVSDGQSALDFLQGRGDHTGSPRPDLVILDLGLPGTSGWVVLEKVASDARLRSIPVVVMSGVTSSQCVLESYRLRANCYICKPQNTQQFERVVNSIKQFWLGTVRLPQKALAGP